MLTSLNSQGVVNIIFYALEDAFWRHATLPILNGRACYGSQIPFPPQTVPLSPEKHRRRPAQLPQNALHSDLGY